MVNPEVNLPFLDCSGLLGRTSLRLRRQWLRVRIRVDYSGLLGRTSLRQNVIADHNFRVNPHCSGLLGRTSLRRLDHQPHPHHAPHCSGLLGRISLRQSLEKLSRQDLKQLFRPSRPDFIETPVEVVQHRQPADCSGLLGRTSLRLSDSTPEPGCLRGLIRPSRPDFIETRTGLGC